MIDVEQHTAAAKFAEIEAVKVERIRMAKMEV